jgi:type I restriction enzyme R subunit
MSRNEIQTCRELIEPALQQASWSWDRRIVIDPGQVNIAGGSMYDDSQQLITDYLLRFWQIPLAVLEAKAENNAAADVQGRVCP